MPDARQWVYQSRNGVKRKISTSEVVSFGRCQDSQRPCAVYLDNLSLAASAAHHVPTLCTLGPLLAISYVGIYLIIDAALCAVTLGAAYIL
jgi:hypothetical protein